MHLHLCVSLWFWPYNCMLYQNHRPALCAQVVKLFCDFGPIGSKPPGLTHRRSKLKAFWEHTECMHMLDQTNLVKLIVVSQDRQWARTNFPEMWNADNWKCSCPVHAINIRHLPLSTWGNLWVKHCNQPIKFCLLLYLFHAEFVTTVFLCVHFVCYACVPACLVLV